MTVSDTCNEVSSDDIQIYISRWWILGCIGLQFILFGMSVYCFGLVNNVFCDFFGITYAMVDWFSISSSASTWLFGAVWTFLSFAKAQQFRRMSLICTACALSGCVCAMIAYTWRSVYVFLYIGGLLTGTLNGFLLIAPVSFIVLWFPDSEVGTALSFEIYGSKTRINFSFSYSNTYSISPFVYY